MTNQIVTVVIPTFNRKIKKNTISNFYTFKELIKIIIIEDGSNFVITSLNKKIKILCPEITYIKYPNNRGQSFACNIGLKNTKTKYIWFFDDDDSVAVNSIRRILGILQLSNKDGYLLSMQRVYNKIEFKKVDPSLRSHSFNVLRDRGQLVNTSCAIFKTDIIKRINGWDNNLYGGTDTDLFLRFSKHGNFSYIKTLPVKVNIAINNRLTNKFFRQQKAKIFFLLKHWSVLTFRRKVYYIYSLLFFFPLFYNFKDKLTLLLVRIKNNIK